MSSKPRSRKNIGARYQQVVADKIALFSKGKIKYRKTSEDFVSDEPQVRSRSMAQQGEDIEMTPSAREILPLSFEVKHTQGMKTLDDWYEQALSNAPKGTVPVVAVHRKRSNRMYAILDLNDYLNDVKYFNK
jgi:hypothetical protein